MRTRIRDWLLRLALAALPAIAACDDGGFNPVPPDPCNVVKQGDYSFELPASPSMTLKIESCRVDADACKNLCFAAINGNGTFGTVTKCDVVFYPAEVSVSVTYNENNCFGEGDGGPVPAQGGPK